MTPLPATADDVPTNALERNRVCIIGRSTCDLIVLLETGMGAQASTGSAATRDGQFFVFDLEGGMVVNLGDTYGVGLSAGFRESINGDGFLLRGRYRRWIDRYTALDLSAGLLVGGDTRGATIQGAIVFADQIALAAELSYVHERSTNALEAGIMVRFGGFLGPLALIGGGIVLQPRD